MEGDGLKVLDGLLTVPGHIPGALNGYVSWNGLGTNFSSSIAGSSQGDCSSVDGSAWQRMNVNELYSSDDEEVAIPQTRNGLTDVGKSGNISSLAKGRAVNGSGGAGGHVVPRVTSGDDRGNGRLLEENGRNVLRRGGALAEFLRRLKAESHMTYLRDDAKMDLPGLLKLNEHELKELKIPRGPLVRIRAAIRLLEQRKAQAAAATNGGQYQQNLEPRGMEQVTHPPMIRATNPWESLGGMSSVIKREAKDGCRNREFSLTGEDLVRELKTPGEVGAVSHLGGGGAGSSSSGGGGGNAAARWAIGGSQQQQPRAVGTVGAGRGGRGGGSSPRLGGGGGSNGIGRGSVDAVGGSEIPVLGTSLSNLLAPKRRDRSGSNTGAVGQQRVTSRGPTPPPLGGPPAAGQRVSQGLGGLPQGELTIGTTSYVTSPRDVASTVPAGLISSPSAPMGNNSMMMMMGGAPGLGHLTSQLLCAESPESQASGGSLFSDMLFGVTQTDTQSLPPTHQTVTMPGISDTLSAPINSIGGRDRAEIFTQQQQQQQLGDQIQQGPREEHEEGQQSEYPLRAVKESDLETETAEREPTGSSALTRDDSVRPTESRTEEIVPEDMASSIKAFREENTRLRESLSAANRAMTELMTRCEKSEASAIAARKEAETLRRRCADLHADLERQAAEAIDDDNRDNKKGLPSEDNEERRRWGERNQTNQASGRHWTLLQSSMDVNPTRANEITGPGLTLRDALPLPRDSLA